MELEWALFDLNGTLLDPSGIGEPLGLGPGESVAALDEAILLSMAETLSGSYRPLPDLLRAALRRRADGDDSRVDEAVEGASRMPPYPDAAAAVDRLREAGLRVGVLTNSATDAAEAALEDAGLSDGMELVVGSDQVRAFKPDQRLYRRGLEATEAEPREACMLAAHAWDLMGAARAGMRTSWVARKEGSLLDTVPQPDIRAETLEQAAARVVGLSEGRDV